MVARFEYFDSLLYRNLWDFELWDIPPKRSLRCVLNQQLSRYIESSPHRMDFWRYYRELREQEVFIKFFSVSGFDITIHWLLSRVFWKGSSTHSEEVPTSSSLVQIFQGPLWWFDWLDHSGITDTPSQENVISQVYYTVTFLSFLRDREYIGLPYQFLHWIEALNPRDSIFYHWWWFFWSCPFEAYIGPFRYQ